MRNGLFAQETDILTEVDSYDWIAFLPMADGSGAYSRYLRRCAEAAAVQAYQKRGLPLAPGMEIGYVVTNAAKWEVDPERDASEFDAGYYRKLLEKAWEEVAFVCYDS